MELTLIRLQSAAPGAVHGERRSRIRHKLNTPVYASFSGASAGMMLDLSEVTDISEDGFSVHSSERLPTDRPVSLSLDLTEPKTYLQSSGLVVWSDGSGRSGIRFTGLPDHAQRELKQWIFVNLLIAATNRAAEATQTPRSVEELPAPQPVLESSLPAATPVPDPTGMLSALEAVRREVHAGGEDLDATLALITERGLSLTGASGAALAMLTDGEMVCRARAGEPAPPLGARVDVKHGLSGECVRSGRLVACEDTATDTRVDAEVCREMRIGSILAAPIVADFRVVGLFEVFSPQPHAFAQVHETALDRLAEIVPKAHPKPVLPTETTSHESPSSASVADPSADTIRETLWEPEREAQEPLKGVPVRLFHIALLVLTLGTVSMVLGYLLAPKIERLWLSKPAPVKTQSATPSVLPAVVRSPNQPLTLAEIRKLAEQGDAEAQWDMASLYHAGNDVPQDDEQAVQWFLRAAEQGHVSAQASLGAHYWAGRGVPEDLSKAYFWSLLALAQGDDTMKSRLEGLSARMTKAQVNDARQQADDWLRQHHAARTTQK